MIEIDVKKDLNTSLGKREAHYNLLISENEFITLFGQSGAGKTTLLRLIAGLETPKSGKIIADGEVWFDSDKKINLSPQKRGVGFVFQDYALFPTMSVEQNLIYACKNEQQKATVSKLLGLVELENLASAYPHQLSGGQKQRVALARAIINEPRILLLDEPLSALDNEMRAKLQNELLSIHREFKIPTLLVSHDIGETIKLSDKVAMIENAQIVRFDNPINIFGKENNKEVFGEIIKVEESKITLLVGANIISIDSEDTQSHTVGEMMSLKIIIGV